MPMRIAVIFDMDGVLIDSYAAHFESWLVLTAENGVEYSRAEFVAGFGRTTPEVIAEQWPGKEANLTDDRIRALAARKEVIFRELIERDFPAMDGAFDLLSALHAADISLAVGSSGPADNVQLVIEKLGARDLFSTAVTSSDVRRGKPDPQVFQLAAERLGVAVNRCVVVEDAPVGIAAARAAGMKCIGLASTGRTGDELQAADLVVGSLRDVTVMDVRRLLDVETGAT
jgi:beta-phosphoglucomutase